jgi:hypothetical protein
VFDFHGVYLFIPSSGLLAYGLQTWLLTAVT